MQKQKQKIIVNGAIEKKKPYVKPVLTSLGDIRDVTMGGSLGNGDSGNAGVEKPF